MVSALTRQDSQIAACTGSRQGQSKLPRSVRGNVLRMPDRQTMFPNSCLLNVQRRGSIYGDFKNSSARKSRLAVELGFVAELDNGLEDIGKRKLVAAESNPGQLFFKAHFHFVRTLFG